MSLILDAGALIAYERGSPPMLLLLRLARDTGIPLKTSAAVTGQVWRNPARQVALGRLLRAVEEVPLTPTRARAIGQLLGAAKASDVVDASVVEMAASGDEILTSDPDDLVRLARHSGKLLRITPVA
jgi:hypothetical protein